MPTRDSTAVTRPSKPLVEQLVDRVDVGGQPGDHPARGVALVEGRRQPLEVVEHPARAGRAARPGRSGPTRTRNALPGDRLDDGREQRTPTTITSSASVSAVAASGGMPRSMPTLTRYGTGQSRRRSRSSTTTSSHHERPLVRAQQAAEQPARLRAAAAAETRARAGRRCVLGGDAAPVACSLGVGTVAVCPVVALRRGRRGRSRRDLLEVGVGREQVAVGRDRREQLAVRADGGDRAVLRAARPGRRAARSTARCATTMPVVSREHPAQRLPRPAPRCARRARTAGRRAPGPRPAEHRPGQREPLALAAGQRHALLADPGVQAPRQVVDELGLGDLERLARRRRRWRRAGRA